MLNTHYRLNEPHVIGEVLEGELVLVHFATGCYFSLQGTAADICNLLRAGSTAAQVAAALASHHQLPEGEMAAAVGPFVERLVQEELLVAAESPPASDDRVGPVAATFSPPVLEKFDDMAEQLLLDPIHEIDQSNWLVRQSA